MRPKCSPTQLGGRAAAGLECTSPGTENVLLLPERSLATVAAGPSCRSEERGSAGRHFLRLVHPGTLPLGLGGQVGGAECSAGPPHHAPY